MESSEEPKRVVRQPFDFGIKRLKRELAQGGMSKSDINKAVKMYKFKVYTRVAEVKAKMEKEMLDASDKQSTALHLGRQPGVSEGSQEQEQAS